MKRGPKVDTSRKIKVLGDNPKKPGTLAHDRFLMYKQDMTVQEALEQGITLRDIRHDAKHEFISLSDPSPMS